MALSLPVVRWRARYQLSIVRPDRDTITSPLLYVSKARCFRGGDWFPVYELIDALCVRLRRYAGATALVIPHDTSNSPRHLLFPTARVIPAQLG